MTQRTLIAWLRRRVREAESMRQQIAADKTNDRKPLIMSLIIEARELSRHRGRAEAFLQVIGHLIATGPRLSRRRKKNKA